MKIIEVIVTPTGETKIETKGFTGADCQAASKFLEQALGKVQHENLTGEFFRQAADQQIQVGGFQA